MSRVRLPTILLASHSTVYEGTEHTPPRLMFGRELWLSVHVATGRAPNVNFPTVSSGYAVALQEAKAKVHRQARRSSRATGMTIKLLTDRVPTGL